MAAVRSVFAYKNLADAGAVSATSTLTLTPPARLTSQFPQVVKKCRNRGENTWAVIVDLLSQQVIDIFALFGTNLTSAASARVRASTADSSGQDGSAYDSGWVAGLVDANYGALIRRAAAPVTARYARIDVSESGIAYIEAGRLFTGPSVQVETNFSPGWGRNRNDLSRQTASEEAVVYIDRRPKQRVWDMSFDFLTASEANGFVEEMNLLNGETDDVLLITDPDSNNLGRDSIWGQITGGQPLIQPYQASDIFSRKFTIRERR